MKGAIIIIKRHIPHESACRGQFQDLLLPFMNMQFQSVRLVDKPIPENMVQMTMGIKQQYRFQLVFIDKILQFFPFLIEIAPWIYDQAFIRFIEKDICVLLEGVEIENFNVYHIG